MVQWLTYVGLAIIPFVILGGYSADYPKEILAIGFASAISLYALQQGIFKSFQGQFWIVLIFLMLISVNFVPATGFMIGAPQQKLGSYMMYDRVDIDGLWNFKPILYALIYLMMVMAIASVEQWPLAHYLEVMAWAGGVVALIAILQHFGFTQFAFTRPVEEIGDVKHAEMYSTMGQPTLMAAFASICAVPALYIKNYWLYALIVGAIFIAHSAFGLLGIVAGTILFMTKHKRLNFILALGMPILLGFAFIHLQMFSDHGRFSVWHQIVHDLRHTLYGHVQFGLFGFGAGAFHYLFPIFHSSGWFHAHNEFLEFFYNNGPLGFILFFCCMFMLFKECFYKFDIPEVKILTAMLIVFLLVAQGTFIFQLGACQFYAVTTLGLLYNQLRGGV